MRAGARICVHVQRVACPEHGLAGAENAVCRQWAGAAAREVGSVVVVSPPVQLWRFLPNLADGLRVYVTDHERQGVARIDLAVRVDADRVVPGSADSGSFFAGPILRVGAVEEFVDHE